MAAAAAPPAPPKLREKPREPGPTECCQSGCHNCVWDMYDAALREWGAQQAGAGAVLEPGASAPAGHSAPQPAQGAGSGTLGGAGVSTGAGGGGAQQGAPPPLAAAAPPSIMPVGRSALEELEARLAAAEAQAQAQAHAPGAPDSQRQPPP